MEIKNVLEVGKARAEQEQQMGEGLDSDDEIGTTTYLNFLAAKINYYNDYLQRIKEKINRFNSKGGRRKKKSKNNVRMRKKTRRKRGGEGKKPKNKLKWKEKNIKEEYPSYSHYENPSTTRHYGTLPTENKSMTTQQVRALIAMRRDAAEKQKTLENLAVAYTRRARLRELKQKKRNPIESLKKKVQKKLTLKKKSEPSNFQPDRIRKGVKYTSLGGRRKRKKKTRRRKGGNIQTFSSISQLKDFLNKSDVFANGDEPREFTLIENGVEIKPSVESNERDKRLTWIYHPGQPGDNDIEFYQTYDDAIWDKSSIKETKTFGIDQLKNMIIDGGEGFKYKYASVGGKRKKKTRKRRKKKTRRKRRRKKAGMPGFQRTKSVKSGLSNLSKYKGPIKTNPKRKLREQAMIRAAQIAAKKAAKKTSETGVAEITEAMKKL